MYYLSVRGCSCFNFRIVVSLLRFSFLKIKKKKKVFSLLYILVLMGSWIDMLERDWIEGQLEINRNRLENFCTYTFVPILMITWMKSVWNLNANVLNFGEFWAYEHLYLLRSNSLFDWVIVLNGWILLELAMLCIWIASLDLNVIMSKGTSRICQFLSLFEPTLKNDPLESNFEP